MLLFLSKAEFSRIKAQFSGLVAVTALEAFTPQAAFISFAIGNLVTLPSTYSTSPGFDHSLLVPACVSASCGSNSSALSYTTLWMISSLVILKLL